MTFPSSFKPIQEEKGSSIRKSFPSSFKPIEQKKEEIPEKKSLFDDFMDMVTSKEESPFETGLGQAMRSVIPAIAGIPGDIAQLGKVTAKMLPEEPKLLKREPNFFQKKGKEILDYIPSSEDIRKKFDVLTDEKYVPKTETEKLTQEIGSDLATLAIPAKKFGQLAKSLSVATSGVLGRKAAEKLGAEEKGQSAAKIGSILISSMINPKGASKYASSLYQDAQNAAKGISVNASKLTSQLAALEKDLTKGLVKDVPSKTPILSASKEIVEKIQKGKIPVDELTEIKKNLNLQRRLKIYDPELRGQKSIIKELKRNYNRLSSIIDDTLTGYGKINKKFGSPYKAANEAYGGIERSRGVSNFVEKTMRKAKLSPVTMGLFHLRPGLVKAGLTVAAPAIPVVKLGELMHRVLMNPTLRGYYTNVMIHAAQENAAGVIRNMNKLDQALSEKENQK